MTDIVSQYANNGVEALNLNICRTDAESDSLNPSERHLLEPFHPLYVYTLFGEAEQIYGYEDLAVKLSFTSGSMHPFVQIKYQNKIPESTSVKADDVEGTLYEYLSADCIKDEGTFREKVEQDSLSFKPVGKIIGSYARKPLKVSLKGKEKNSNKTWKPCSINDEDAIVYEAYHTTIETPGWYNFLRHIQIFPYLYIEGGTAVDEHDKRWEFISLFERRKSPKSTPEAIHFTYHFIGYSSLYRFYFHPDQLRIRLAQFIILPPFQKAGHGSRLYAMIYLWIKGRQDVAELTVEDPSEQFQLLRDKADLQYALSQDIFSVKEAPIAPEWIKATRQQLKLGERQFARVMEMLLLLRLDQTNLDKVKSFRLFVKERLYRQNYEILASMDVQERRDALKSTFDSVIEEYASLIASITAAAYTM